EAPFDAEDTLHSAFERHPELFPTEDMDLGQLLVVGREVAFESGSADLVLVDEGGEIVIAEFKKGAENPDSRRVVAQLLDYGAALWKQAPDEFAAKIALPYLRSRHPNLAASGTLEEAARELLGLDEERTEQFSRGFVQNLSAGTFNYVVVARTLPPTIGNVLQYLGAVSRLKPYAVTVDYFRDSAQREIMVPLVAFAPVTVTPALVDKKANPDTFLKDVGPAVDFWDRFLQFLNGLPGRFYWGTKGFSYRVVIAGKQYPILRGWPRTVWWLKDKGIGDELEIALEASPGQPGRLASMISEHLGRLHQCPGANPKTEGAKKVVSFYVQSGLPQVEDEITQALTALFESAIEAQP
ncbi:MAG TPA: PD-(D/E)XK nuclease family protein, partial [Chloroflexota bacterium]|nr:PD-(D/E)XK nuclease family protein [Chloroflexota bacterium]